MSFRNFLAALFGVLAVAALVAAPAQAEPAKTRVLIIPGQYVGATAYQPMAQNLTSRGYPATVLDLKGFNMRSDAKAIAAEMARRHKAHPRDKFAIVGHSIGGVSGRLYLKDYQGATDLVTTYVSIGSPQYGSPGACGQAAPEVCPDTPFMKTLNKGDDTPGATKYFSVRSSREWLTGDLDGGQCRVTPIPANEALPALGYEHTFEPFDSRIFDVTVAALKGKCVGKFVTDPDGKLNYHNSDLPGAPGYQR